MNVLNLLGLSKTVAKVLVKQFFKCCQNLILTEIKFCQLQQTGLSRFAWNERYVVSSLKVQKIQQCLSVAFYTSRNFGPRQSESREARDGNV